MKSAYSKLDYNKLVSFIWSVADDCLRDYYVRGKYRDVIIPMTLIRRFDAIIESKKDEILKIKQRAEKNNWDVAKTLDELMGSIYNSSQFSLKDLKNETNRQNLRMNFEEYLNGFSENIKEILNKFDFNTQIKKMNDANILGLVIEKFTSSELNLSPYDSKNSDGKTIKGLDNHAMGTLFEEIIRKFNEENNEEAGEHFTPRDVVELMADIAVYPIIDKIQNGTYTIYDGACGTLGMCTVAEERLKTLAEKNGKEVSIHLIGQEVNSETYAIAKADLIIKGGDKDAENVYFGSTISQDGASGSTFDFMLSNPPYGKTWKTDLAIIGQGSNKDPKKNVTDKRFVKSYKEQEDFRMIPDISDGQLLFLLNNVAKMKNSKLGSRIVEVHNGSALFTGDAGSGASNARRYMIEQDLVEAIIELPQNMFYNTGISTHIWVLSNRKENKRKGKIQLINASNIKTALRKNMGSKNCEFSEENRKFIMDLYLKFEENEYSKIFSNEEFGYYKVTVERPLKKAVWCNEANVNEVVNELDRLGIFERERESYIDSALLDNSFVKNTSSAIKELCNAENMKTYLQVLKQMQRDEKYLDFTGFEKEFNNKLKKSKIKGLSFTKLLSTGLLSKMIIQDEHASAQKDAKGSIIVDPELRDTENVPMTFSGGIKEFIKDEVLPYHPDAFVDETKTQIGYEINFTKYFYKPKELESVEDIVKRIKEIEKESDGMLSSILKDFYE